MAFLIRVAIEWNVSWMEEDEKELAINLMREFNALKKKETNK